MTGTSIDIDAHQQEQQSSVDSVGKIEQEHRAKKAPKSSKPKVSRKKRNLCAAEPKMTGSKRNTRGPELKPDTDLTHRRGAKRRLEKIVPQMHLLLTPPCTTYPR
jgi:hypothetical protein